MSVKTWYEVLAPGMLLSAPRDRGSRNWEQLRCSSVASLQVEEEDALEVKRVSFTTECTPPILDPLGTRQTLGSGGWGFQSALPTSRALVWTRRRSQLPLFISSIRIHLYHSLFFLTCWAGRLRRTWNVYSGHSLEGLISRGWILDSRGRGRLAPLSIWGELWLL